MIGRNIINSSCILLVLMVELSSCYVISSEDSNQALNSISSSPVKDPSLPPPKISKQSQQLTTSDYSNNTSSLEDSTAAQAELEQFWMNHRDHFFNVTSFNLTKVSVD